MALLLKSALQLLAASAHVQAFSDDLFARFASECEIVPNLYFGLRADIPFTFAHARCAMEIH